MNPLRLTLYLIDGSRVYIEKDSDVADLLMDLNRNRSIMSNDVWYPLHAMVKIKFDWEGRISEEEYQRAVAEPDWPTVKRLMDEFKARRRRKKKKTVASGETDRQ